MIAAPSPEIVRLKQRFDDAKALYENAHQRHVAPYETLRELGARLDRATAALGRALAGEYRNAWGDDPQMYSEEFCPQCAKLLPGHYNNCSIEGRIMAKAALEAVQFAARFDKTKTTTA